MLGGDAVTAALSLLGAVLTSTVAGTATSGRIVEVEAYLGPDDPASHAAARIGRTRRNEPMFGPAGTAYVYRIYGVHRCFNVVTGETGFPAAVLVRALEPLSGLDAMAERRGRSTDLCTGPGRLAEALGIDESMNAGGLEGPILRLQTGHRVPESEIAVTGRIGLSRAAHWPLRYFVAGSPHVSRQRAPEPRWTADFLTALSTVSPTVAEEYR